MRTCIAVAMLAFSAAVLAAPAVAVKNESSDRAAIETLERQWLNGISDRATLERVLADDFRHQVAAGIFLSKAQHIAWAVAHPRPAGRVADFESLDVRVYGDTAIATGVVRESDHSGENPRRSIFTDVFVRRNGVWKAVSAAENVIEGAATRPRI